MVQEPERPMDSKPRQQDAGDQAQAVELDRQGLLQQLDALTQERDALKDKYLRALADYQNSQKRAATERVEAGHHAQADVAKALLPVLDNFERTLEAARTAKDAGALAKGVQIIHEQMLKALAEFGVRRMEVRKGDPFDPVSQQAVAQQPTDEVKPEHILHVAQVGYTMRDRILRPATVVVAKEPVTSGRNQETKE